MVNDINLCENSAENDKVFFLCCYGNAFFCEEAHKKLNESN